MTILVDRREIYRISFAEHASSRIELRSEHGHWSLDARLADMNMSGASAILPGVPSTEPQLRERMLVSFHGIAPDLFAWAIVRNVLKVDDYVRIGFEFESQDRLRLDLPDRLRAWFNRRSAPRAKHLALSCALGGGAGERFSAEVTDLSTSGAGILFHPQLAPTLELGQSLALEFRFSDIHEPIQMVSRIRNLHELPPLAAFERRVGVEFDAGATPQFRQQRDAVSLFVDDRAARGLPLPDVDPSL